MRRGGGRRGALWTWTWAEDTTSVHLATWLIHPWGPWGSGELIVRLTGGPAVPPGPVPTGFCQSWQKPRLLLWGVRPTRPFLAAPGLGALPSPWTPRGFFPSFQNCLLICYYCGHRTLETSHHAYGCLPWPYAWHDSRSVDTHTCSVASEATDSVQVRGRKCVVGRGRCSRPRPRAVRRARGRGCVVRRRCRPRPRAVRRARARVRPRPRRRGRPRPRAVRRARARSVGRGRCLRSRPRLPMGRARVRGRGRARWEDESEDADPHVNWHILQYV